MTQGAVLIARNNKEIDYIKQAVFLASRIEKYLELPTTLITDNTEYLKKNNLTSYFDKVISIESNISYTIKKYRDGLVYQNSLDFKNTDRSTVYDLTPYNETLLLDTDLIISDNTFKNCFTQSSDLLMYSNAFELSGWRDTSEFKFITDAGPKFYWATAIFFKKTEENQIFFNLVKHIQENWVHYKKLYQIVSPVFRNDFAFSIAVHIMNGYTTNNFVKEMPGTLYYTTDRDELVELKDDSFLFLIAKENQYEQFLSRIKGKTVHVMNKYSLNRVINDC
jgi:hypothetical protein